MSVAVAIIAADCAVVASDGRRTEPDGSYRDDYDKTFRLPDVMVVGIHVGLLEFAGRSVPRWIETLPLKDYPSLGKLADAAGELLKRELTALSENEVGFAHRNVDVVLVGKANLKSGTTICESIMIRPDLPNRRINLNRTRQPEMCVTGDDMAQETILRAMNLPPNPRTLSRIPLMNTARTFIKLGIQSAGPHRNFPNNGSCGGGPFLRCL